MLQAFEILPGVMLRCMQDLRFKQGALSVQFLRRMDRQEAAQNALLPAVLLRGCRDYPDLRCITQKLDDLYGASVGTLVRRIGDYQTTGVYCGFMEDRFAFDGDAILAPMVDFMGQLLLQPILEDGGFDAEFVESEKRNLIAAIESELSDKRSYAAGRLLEIMCKADSFGVPRLGDVPHVEQIDHRSLYAHYQKLLSESPVEVFYVGSADAQAVADALKPVFAGIDRQVVALPVQTAYGYCQEADLWEQQNIAQGKLSLGFYTEITNRDARFAAMQVLNTVFGSGMTSKLFMQVREKMSLCYAIGSSYFGSKGILTVNAGIDTEQQENARAAIFRQLEACKAGEVTEEELQAAKEAILSSLRAVYDSPGAIESFFSTAAISDLGRTPESYAAEVNAVTLEDVVAAANTVRFHSAFFLKGERHG